MRRRSTGFWYMVDSILLVVLLLGVIAVIQASHPPPVANLPSFGVPSVGTPTDTPNPDLTPAPSPVPTWQWDSALTTDWGAADAHNGFAALVFANLTEPPGLYTNTARSYRGATLSGNVDVYSVVSTTAPYTFTFSLSQYEPVGGVVTMTQYMDLPLESAVAITGTITHVDCGLLRSGVCKFGITCIEIQGQPCN